MKVREMRKKISTSLKQGKLEEIGTRPSAPSKVIRMMNQHACKEAIILERINWDKLTGASTPTSTPTDSETPYSENEDGKKADSDAKNDKSQGSRNSEEKSDKNDAKCSVKAQASVQNAEIEYFTNKGAHKGNELLANLGIQDIVKNHAEQIASNYRSHRVLSDRIDNISEGGAQTIVVDVNKQPIVKLKDEIVHKKFDDICRLARLYKNVMLVGPAGTGKTTIGSQVAKALDTDFAHISVTAGMSEAHLLGRMLFDGSYVESDFVRIYENGGVFLLDEFDSADSNCAVVVNSALANGFMSVPNRKDKPTAKRHPNCVIIACANTWGTGGGTVQYTGRNKLDSATLDRFCSSKVEVDYDAKLERALANDKSLYRVLLSLRKECKRQNVLRIISTRLFLNGQIWMNDGGDIPSYVKQITIDWTKEEIAKVGLTSIVKEVA